jgi:S-adenosylmethionine:tRNA ribosyltransferase-isomerase
MSLDTGVRFQLPPDRSADRPPEARGLARDQVRLLVAGAGRHADSGTPAVADSPYAIRHSRFADLAGFLRSGDLVVVNDSATLPAALDAVHADGRRAAVHLSTQLDDGTWVVEVRPATDAHGPMLGLRSGDRLNLPRGVTLTLRRPYPDPSTPVPRLWTATVPVTSPLAYLRRHGRPITYDYLVGRWPLEAFQTMFARSPGSAEMPSAARPFTPRVVSSLRRAGVMLASVTLHTGVSSPEAGEPPMPERFTVPSDTTRLVDVTKRTGGRVIAVGTTVTRALESVARPDGSLTAGSGWTDLVLSRSRPAYVVDGLISGWHAPGASHLSLLEAVAGAGLVSAAYDAALAGDYLWHEFGDSCLLLPAAE